MWQWCWDQLRIDLKIMKITLSLDEGRTVPTWEEVSMKYSPHGDCLKTRVVPSLRTTWKALLTRLSKATWNRESARTRESDKIFAIPDGWYHTVPYPAKSPTMVAVVFPAVVWITISFGAGRMLRRREALWKTSIVDWLSKRIHELGMQRSFDVFIP
jgi:hypothetical protein